MTLTYDRFFITATGTDIGKTYIAAALTRHWREAGLDVRAVKPIVSGFSEENAAASDPGILLAAQGQDLQDIALCAPFRFAAPLSPDMAARREGKSIVFPLLIEWCQSVLQQRHDVALIEGVGGIMVPLTDEHTVLDWMAALSLPTILVAGSYLGTLSHTLSAYQVLRAATIPVAAIIVNETPDSKVPLDETAETIKRFVQTPVLCLPRQGSIAAIATQLRPA